jgi:hypothetical protein
MFRNLLAATGVLALLASPAAAQYGGYGYSGYGYSSPTTVTVTQTAPHRGKAAKKVTKRYRDRYGRMVTVTRTVRRGHYGSSVHSSKSVTDPYGRTVTRSRVDRGW